jgi:hypothetical protein
MAQEAPGPNDTTLNLRIDAKLKAEFSAAVGDRPVAEVLRSLMRDYVEITRKLQFAAEARRQSQLVASSEDEAEMVRWIEEINSKRGEQ